MILLTYCERSDNMKEFQNLTQEMIDECKSYASLLRLLDKPINGWEQQRLKEFIKEQNFDVSHFTGQGWNKNNFDFSRFRKNQHVKSSTLRSGIACLRGYQCEMCGISKWEDITIPLEVHHIDGDCLNNEMDNLMLLCPNCHSVTKNWRGRNQSKEVVSDEKLIDAIMETPNIRQALLKVGLSPKGGNYQRVYELKVKHNL